MIFFVDKIGPFDYRVIMKYKYGSECISEKFWTRRGADKAMRSIEYVQRRGREICDYDKMMPVIEANGQS